MNGGEPRKEGSTVTSILPSLVLDTGTDLVIVLIVEVVVIEGSDLATDGLVIKGSTTEIINTHGSRRKLGVIRVLSWNVWGLGSSVKRKTIRIVLRKQCIEMVFLVETKLKVVSDSLIKSIWWTDSFKYVLPPSVGLSGDLIVFFWEISKFTLHGVCRDSRFLLVSGIWVLDEWTCGMIVVYVPCETGEQLVCWHSLTALIASLALPIKAGTKLLNDLDEQGGVNISSEVLVVT
ncbi:hypothetical protein V6N13_073951 [Hibiscus sabdariffa]